MQDLFSAAAALLPRDCGAAAARIPRALRERTEEFRLRCGRPPGILLPEGERPLTETPVSPAMLAETLEKATAASFHAVSEELRRGFISAPGGIRIGVCGTAVTDGAVKAIRDVSSLNLRIPRQCRGVGRAAIEALGEDGALVISPPGGGKTTFLRELVRTVSDRGLRVGLADERGELAGMWGGTPGFDVGRCTDVMTGAPKAEAALALLRSMGPQAVAMDEIGAPEDAAAVELLLGCGVRIYATAHAPSPEALLGRPLFRRLADAGAFRKLVCISGTGPRRYEVVTL